MKQIVCFGDSNTWGWDPRTCTRYGRDVRWPCLMQRLLGEEYEVAEDGISGRTGGVPDYAEPYKCGVDSIDACMMSNMPVDLVIIMLGINDTKVYLNASARSIMKGIEQVALHAENIDYGNGKKPKVLIAAPTPVGDYVEQTWAVEAFDRSSVQKLKELAPMLKEVAEHRGWEFINAAELGISPSEEDAMHLYPEGHRILAEAMAEKVREIFED